MTSSFIPRKIAQLRGWLLNFFTNLPGQAAAVHFSSTKVDAAKANAQQGIDLIDALVEAKAAQKSAVTALHIWQKPGGKGMGQLRKDVDEIKTDPGYTKVIGDLLRTVGIHEDFDALDFKPEGTGTAHPGYVLIEFLKYGVELMSISFRLKGDTEWTHLCNISGNNYHHHFTLPITDPPASPAIYSVVLEYKLEGIMHDVLIGDPSNTITVLFAL
jgi:hypothetical protein